MNTIRKYGFALKLLGAALLVGLAIVLEVKREEAQDIVIAIIGAIIILYAVIRLVPFVKTQGSDLIKTINIMEITIDVLLGIAMIVIQFTVDGGLGVALGYMLGTYLVLRGSVHFYSVSEGNEKSDHVLYFFHIACLVVGGVVLVSGDIDAVLIIHIILGFSVVVGGFLIYDGGKGYKVYRYEKAVYDQEIPSDSKTVEKELPVVGDEAEKEQPNIVA